MGEGIDTPEVTNRPPGFLYRFRSSETAYFEEELYNTFQRRIFMPSVEQLNDPFEHSPAYVPSSLKDINHFIDKVQRKFGKWALPTGTILPIESIPDRLDRRNIKRQLLTRGPERARRHRRTIELMLARVPKQHGVACFCENVESLLMWPHYTSSHRGIAIVYSWDDLALHSGDSLNPIRIRYAEDRPRLSTVDLFRMGGMLDFGSDHLNEEKLEKDLVEALYFTKSIEWQYEKEWRIFATGRTGYQQVVSMTPVAVIVGARATDDTRQTIVSAARGQVEVVDAGLDPVEFKLNIPPFGDRQG